MIRAAVDVRVFFDPDKSGVFNPHRHSCAFVFIRGGSLSFNHYEYGDEI